jgi:mono/diheme cytochrome c family protein
VTRYLLSLTAAGAGLLWALWPGSALSHETVKTSVTFDREISRILSSKCITCHSEANLAFPLTTYEETRPWAQAIEEEVLSRHMPPWRAVAGYGKFANDGALTTRELQTIVAWVQGNGPKSPDQTLIVNIDQGTTPQNLRLKPDFDRWQLGRPDLIRPIGSSVERSQPGAAVRTVVDLEMKGDRRIRALEFRPADRRVLRGAFFWLEASGQWLGSWTPWHSATSLPDEAAYLVPGGSRVVAELHYQGAAPAAARDAGQLGVYYAAGAPAQCPSDLILRADGDVAPRATNQKFQAVTALSADTTLLALIPQLAEGARSLEVRARKPDGTVGVLLLVRDVLHDWPTPYIFETPARLPKGTELLATSYYSNASDQARDGGVDVRVSRLNESRGGACSARLPPRADQGRPLR